MVKLEELLTHPRKSAGSYAELCPWYCNIGDSLVLTFDGMLLAGFQFEGMDVDGKTDDEVNHQLDIIEKSINTLDERITLYSYLDRRRGLRLKKSNYTNWYAEKCNSQLMNKLDREYTSFSHTLFLGFKTPSTTDSLISKINAYSEEESNVFIAFFKSVSDVVSGRGSVSSIKRQLASMHEAFEEVLHNFSTLAGNLVKLNRLVGKELDGELFRRANPASISGPLNLGERNWFLPSRIVADTMVRDGLSVKFIGPTMEKHVKVLSVIEEPSKVSSLHIDSLLEVDAEFTLCQIFQVIDNLDAQKLIQDHEMYYRSEVKDVMTRLAERISGQNIDKENTGFTALADEAQEALVALTTDNLKHGYHSTRLLIYADDQDALKRDTGKVATKLRQNGYGLTVETTGLYGALLSTLPGYTKVNPRKYLAAVDKVTDLMPMRGKSQGKNTHKLFSEKLGREVPCHVVFDTESQIPYQFNCHVGDVGHSLIIGGTGAGKTTLMNLLITEHQKYMPCKTYIFDKDYSMSVPTVLLGGKHIDGGKQNSLSTNPLKRFLKDGNLNMANQWISILLNSSGDQLSSEEKEIISNAIHKTFTSGSESWSLTMLYTFIHGVDQKLASRLQPFVNISELNTESGKGLFSGYFDADNDAYEIADIMCFECSKVISIPEIAAPFLFYVTYCIEQGLDGSTPTLIFIEESWHYFKNPIFAETLEDWSRTLRKKLAYLVLVTQGTKEFAEISCGDVIINMSPTKIFLPLITHMTDAEKERYKQMFGINDHEFAMINRAVPKRDYIIKQPGITKLVTSVMPELTLLSNDACAVERVRNKALDMAKDGVVNWRKNFIKEELHVSV